MSDPNKQIVRRFRRAFAAGDVSTLAAIVAEDVRDNQAPPGSRPGRQGLLDAVAMFRAGVFRISRSRSSARSPRATWSPSTA